MPTNTKPEITAYYPSQEKYKQILELLFVELEKADDKYPHDKMSIKEMKTSFLTLNCEVLELNREIERLNRRPRMLHKEAIQVLAMAFKFVRDVSLPMQEG